MRIWLYALSFLATKSSASTEIDPLTGEVLRPATRLHIYPAKHWVTPPERLDTSIELIQEELEWGDGSARKPRANYWKRPA